MVKQRFVFLAAVLGIVAIPATAKDIFSADVIPCAAAANVPANCGPNLQATDPLRSGEVHVDEDGEVRVVLKGAAANTVYSLFVGTWGGNDWQSEYRGGGPCSGLDFGTVTTDSSGNYKGPVRAYNDSGSNFVFASGTRITQLNFVFNNRPCGAGATQFSTGIRVP